MSASHSVALFLYTRCCDPVVPKLLLIAYHL